MNGKRGSYGQRKKSQSNSVYEGRIGSFSNCLSAVVCLSVLRARTDLPIIDGLRIGFGASQMMLCEVDIGATDLINHKYSQGMNFDL